MVKTVQYVEELDYYDMVLLFHAQDSNGGDYLGMALASSGDMDEYAVFSISPEQLRRLKYGLVGLLSLIKERKAPEWYIGVFPDHGDGVEVHLEKQVTPLTETPHLPGPGYFLRHGKLAVAAVGQGNSGKSETWRQLFGARRNGNGRLHLKLTPSQCVEVFCINRSFEEQGKRTEELLQGVDCPIILCSMQYAETAVERLGHFSDGGYYTYVQWLNPGHAGKVRAPDSLGLESKVRDIYYAEFHLRDGNQPPAQRARGLKELIYDWASDRDLVLDCKAAH